MHLLKAVATRLTAGALSVMMLAAPALAVSGSVNADGGLNLREKSSTASDSITTIPNGSSIEVVAKTGDGWYQVTYGDATGFVSGDYVTVSDEDAATLDTLAEPIYGQIAEGPLNVRSGPGTDYSKVKQLNAGNIVEITETADGWYAIDGGYVSADYVTIIDEETALAAMPSSSGSGVVDYAMQYLGYRYCYGGSSPSSGFDCSGFAKYVYANFGVTLNRTASAQMDNGTAVSKSELQPGDLVFFLKAGSGASRASHVGIYIGGNQFIHASTSSTGVIISDMDSAYYTTGFVGARRIL